MSAPFKSLPIGASFTLSGIKYRKVSDVAAESEYAIAIMDGGDAVVL